MDDSIMSRQRNRKYVYGEVNGVPVTEEEMRVIEETQEKQKTPEERELEDLANQFKGRKRPAPTPKPMKSGGMVSSASKRADGCAQRGKTRGKIV